MHLDRGHLVWIDFDPQAGSEQAGRRPALVLSPGGYHERTRLAVVCPITSKAKGFPFEVRLPDGLPIAGVVLADHVKSVDRSARHLEVVGQAPPSVVEEVQAKLAPLLGLRA
ncbi:MAG TPA: type II toxin-antitoxin system PemK/MazF family toxin [Azospirillaceae bacterium]|nr:type II toxin-antitoxin system PemK/MazF family toxin [Azospirillaceae bacterium]